MGWNKIRPVAAARIVVTDGTPAVDANVSNFGIASVTDLGVGRYQINSEGNSQFELGSATSRGSGGVVVHVLPEAATTIACFATVEARVSGNYVVINMYDAGSGPPASGTPYGVNADRSFYILISNVCAAFE